MISTDGYNNVDHCSDGYMEQEEEWEREGLLDPAWEKQQKKVKTQALHSAGYVSHTDRQMRPKSGLWKQLIIGSASNGVRGDLPTRVV